MSKTFEEQKAELESISEKIDAIGTGITGLQGTVTDLKAQIASMGLSQNQEDQLSAIADQISEHVDNIITALNPAPEDNSGTDEQA